MPTPLPSPWTGAWRNAALFLLTVASIYWVGLTRYPMGHAGGVRLVVAVIAIMLTHEMGHYVACRRYGVDASLPFFIPFPFHMVGTFGAFIRIRSPFPDRRVLFDVGIAGPLAGFVVCLPVLALGILEARVVPETFGGLGLGEPLLFQWATALLRSDVPAGATLVIGPLGMAAWFGLLLTALNLMPIGQLDGGHVVYALLRERATLVSRLALAASVFLVYLRTELAGLVACCCSSSRGRIRRRCATRGRSGRGRVVVGLIGLAVFVVSFTPEPIMISWADFLQAWREVF